MYRLCILGLTLLFVACQQEAPLPPAPAAKAVSLELADQIPLYITQFQQEFEEKLSECRSPGAAVAIVKDSTILLLQGYGMRNSRTGDPVDEHTVFRIASLSKGFTGVLTAKMVEEGYLSWDDRICESIPQFTLKNADHARNLTVKHILSHSSGLVRHAYTNLIEKGLSIKETIPFFAELGVYGEAGQHFAYQNAAFALIEEVFQNKTGAAFSAALEEQLFQPAGMHDASCSHKAISTGDNVALPHYWSSSRQGYVSKPISKKYYNAVSAGGVNASIHDMSRWMSLLLGNRPDIVSEEALDLVFSPIVASNSRRHNTWKGVGASAYGMGWRVFDYKGRSLIYHGGYVNNYRSEIAIDRENNLGICVLFNAPTSFAKKVIPMFLDHLEAHRDIAMHTTTFDPNQHIIND